MGRALYGVEMTPASPEPVSWHAVSGDLNSYRISDIALLRKVILVATAAVPKGTTSRG